MDNYKKYDLHSAAGYYNSSLDNPDIRPLAEIERQYIEEVIAICNGNIVEASKLLEISPSTIYRKQSQWRNANI